MLAELVCPACRSPLERGGDELACRSCDRRFPVVAGIPDVRLAGDSYLSLEDDRSKALALSKVGGTFEDLLRTYWSWTPEVPTPLADRYVTSAVAAVARGREHLRRLDRVEGPLLDVGCGTGGLLVAAAREGCRVAGLDVALRWLVIARRRLEEEGVHAELVAADGALPPFRAGAFGTICCIEVLEHAGDPRGLLHWCLAGARADGRSYVVTANRYSVAPEPTVGLFGVGFLPRRWAAPYVRWRRATRYQHFRAPSRHELRAMAAQGAPGARAPVRVAPAILPPAPPGSPVTRRLAAGVYERLRTSTVAAPALGAVAPYLEVVA